MTPREILEGARIHDDDPETKLVFCLGPGGDRINFESQQTRALNVVWAMAEEGLLRINDRVAVVGAGLAGVTAAVAMRAYGASVELFDKFPEPLTRQSGAHHREVYPNINFWPESSPPSPSTSFPFLNWHLDRCDIIISDLLDEWRLLSEFHDGDLKFTEEEIEEIETEEFKADNKISLRLAKGGKRSNYRLVLVACGYGEDSSYKSFESHDYWLPDGLETKVAKNDNEISHFFVSGAGDGGQIDSLRMATKFKQGRLAFDLARALSGTKVAALFKWRKGRPNEASFDEKSYHSSIQKILNSKSGELLEAKKVLEKGLSFIPPKLVFLVQKDISPYETRAAVIHKLLVKAAEGRRHLKIYSNSKLTSTSAKGKVEVLSKGSEKKESVARNKSHVVIRHGAEPSFANLLSDAEVKSAKSNHQTLKHVDYQPAWEGVYPVPDGLICSSKNLPEYIEQVYSRAQKAMLAYGIEGVSLRKSHKGFIAYGVPKNTKLPTSLYGVPLKIGAPDKVYDGID